MPLSTPVAAATNPATARVAAGTAATTSFSSCAAPGAVGNTDCVAGDLLDNYVIVSPIRSGAVTQADFTAIGIMVTTTAGTNNVGTDIDDTGLSIADFNNFRKRVAVAIDALDRKIEDILRVTNPTCT